jgi:RNA polymerase sigma-70 factor, ECF subfamily
LERHKRVTSLKEAKENARSSASSTPGADLVERAQRGEEEAFRALFEAHKRRVYSLCLRMTRSTADAEDLTQEVFLKVFRKISTFRGQSTFATWLHRLTVNEALMHLRKKRLLRVPLNGRDDSQGDSPISEYREDDRRLMGTIDRINLNDAIAQLSPGFRTAIVLFDLQGYEHSEIAVMCDRSVGNSKSQLHKARRRLRELLVLRGENARSSKRANLRPQFWQMEGLAER